MAASATSRRIDEVLAAARKDLEAQLDTVRSEIARLAAEEQQLTATLASLQPNRSSSSGTPDGGGRRSSSRNANSTKGKARSTGGRRARSRRTASKPTAERLEELRALLASGPKSRTDLAAALKVSPARVQQLLGGLGTSVSSQPDGDKRGKLWSINDAGNGASAAKPRKRGRRPAKGGAPAKPRARKAAAAK
jgi:hypothetical protein